MLWKKEFEIGIENIDEQHKELFTRYNDLFNCISVTNENEKVLKEVEETLDFLSEYVIFHFENEEKYQQEIKYPHREGHKKIHSEFKKTIIDYKREILKTPNNQELIKSFCGFLSTWLINHVCDEDQHISNFLNNITIEKTLLNFDEPLKIVAQCIKDVFFLIAQIEVKDTNYFDLESKNVIAISVKISGEYQKELVFKFSKPFISELIKKMLSLDTVEVDTFATSALKEIVNTIAGHIINYLGNLNIQCSFSPSEIISPYYNTPSDSLYFDSLEGKFKLYFEQN